MSIPMTPGSSGVIYKRSMRNAPTIDDGATDAAVADDVTEQDEAAAVAEAEAAEAASQAQSDADAAAVPAEAEGSVPADVPADALDEGNEEEVPASE